jgi:molybdopterin molybdotransferase
MQSIRDAQAIILNLVQPLDKQRDIEVVDLLAADRRILATPVTSSLDFPHWDNSAMDGYAVRYEDVQHSSAEKPTVLEIVEEIPAGYQPNSAIGLGQAARIFTGALMPAGADTKPRFHPGCAKTPRICQIQRIFLPSWNTITTSRY